MLDLPMNGDDPYLQCGAWLAVCISDSYWSTATASTWKNRFYDFTYTWLFAVYVKTKPYTWKFSRVRDFPNGTTLRYVPTLREGENHALETPTETISDFETIKISRPNNINVEIQFKKHFMRHNRFGLLISRNSVAT